MYSGDSLRGTILVTGAAGKTGQAVISALSQKGAVVRALVRREKQVKLVQFAGAQEVLVGDLRDASALHESTVNIRAIYHICPNMHPDEVQIGQNILAAARSAGVRHFVYHSVLHPQTEKMPHHWNKLKAEEMLFESTLPFTVLQPTAYMQNILANWRSITEQGIFPVPYSVESRISLVDLHDVGEVAAMVLTDTGHQGATYELVGTEPLAQTTVASILSQELNRPVTAQEIPLGDWRAKAVAAGTLSPYALETLFQMFQYYAKFGLEGNPHVLRYLLGRSPTSLSDFVSREMA